MSIIRAILRTLILFFDRVFAPKPLNRAPQAQALADQQTAKLALYQLEACPFCVKVRREIKRLNLSLELRDVRRDKSFDKELVSQGGKFQVPCLRIANDDGSVQWMYESSDIIHYLRSRFSA